MMASASAVEHRYRYVGGTTLDQDRGPGTATYLATSGGIAAHPYFFTGLLPVPHRDAALLLGVAKIGGTRFFTPSAAIAALIRAADPVVTSDGDRLRFESFALCNGVYARLDIERPPGEVHGVGSTNVDFNAPFQHSLAALRRGEPASLSVGADEVTLETMSATVTERRIDLPHRWLRGFAEVALVQSRLSPRLELDKVRTLRFLSELSRFPNRDESWLVMTDAGPALTAEPATDGVFIAGIDRLRPLAPFAAHAVGLRVLGSAETGSASAWALDFGDARFVLGLSPARNRGFSAEGSVLLDLTDPDAGALAARVELPMVTGSAADLIGRAGHGASPEQLRACLGVIGATGRVGFDVVESCWFVRDLPFDLPEPMRLHPRLRDARRLVEQGGVVIIDAAEGRATVQSGAARYDTFTRDRRWSCTCQWVAENGVDRGPCKHVLAARIVLDPAPPSDG